MNQINCVIVTILYCFGVTEKGQGVFVSQSGTKWDESTCTLAQPDFMCSDDGSCVVENGLELLKNIRIPNKGVWIGLTNTWISYAYVGCNQVNVGAEYSVSSLGDCRRRTGCQTFGIRNSTEGLRCKCASNSQVYSGTCRRKCEEADQYPCGDLTNATMFSIYTVENVPPSSNAQDKEKNCLLFYYAYGGKGHDFYWESCNFMDTPGLLCSGTNFSDQNQMAHTDEEFKQIWALAVDHCFDGKNFPATIQSIQNAQFTVQNKRDYWTGIIKKESIISLNYELDYSTNLPVTYAYLEQINQNVYVRFANAGESRKSLCVEGEGSTAGLAAGLSISLALLFVAMIIVLLLLRRRGLLPELCKHNDDKNSNTVDTATEVSFVSTSISESTTNTMQDLTASNHSYFVLEKTFEVTNKEETDHYAEPDISDADHHDSTKTLQKNTDNNYDTIDSEKASAMPGLTKLNNVYNKVTLHQTNEYDHVHLNGRQTKHDRQTENEYDLSSNVIDSRRDKGYDDDSDTYNRLKKQDSKSSGIGEVYGMPNTDGDSGYDTSLALKHTRNTATKEYNHVHLNGRQTKDDRQTENEYDLSSNVIDGRRDKGYDDDSDNYNRLKKQDSKSSGIGEVYGMPNTDSDSGYDTSLALKHTRNTATKDQQPEYAVIKKKW